MAYADVKGGYGVSYTWPREDAWVLSRVLLYGSLLIMTKGETSLDA